MKDLRLELPKKNTSRTKGKEKMKNRPVSTIQNHRMKIRKKQLKTHGKSIKIQWIIKNKRLTMVELMEKTRTWRYRCLKRKKVRAKR